MCWVVCWVGGACLAVDVSCCGDEYYSALVGVVDCCFEVACVDDGFCWVA